MRRVIGRLGCLSALLLGSAGCGALDVSDPTAIEQSELENASGANLLRRDALEQLYRAVGYDALGSGVLTDELINETPEYFGQVGMLYSTESLDRRASLQFEGLMVTGGGGTYSRWQGARSAGAQAMAALRKYGSPAQVGQMFAVRAFATLSLAEDYCPGFPLHDVVDFVVVNGPPLSTDEAFEHALAEFDSAVAYAADSAAILNWARVGRGRALLGLGRFADAAAAVADVSPDFVVNAEYVSNSTVIQDNPLGFRTSDYDYYLGIADHEGGSGLDFLSSGDPRISRTYADTAADGTPLYLPYPTVDNSLAMASGREARLITAEAALNTGGDWRGILNELRAEFGAPLTPLPDPGTSDARVDLLFRERAFWLFATGHRLGDLRRLIHHYDRAANDVFPVGAYRLGGAYETATNIPFPAALEARFNPAVTGCTER